MYRASTVASVLRKSTNTEPSKTPEKLRSEGMNGGNDDGPGCGNALRIRFREPIFHAHFRKHVFQQRATCRLLSTTIDFAEALQGQKTLRPGVEGEEIGSVEGRTSLWRQ
jgi:hypothetical protein